MNPLHILETEDTPIVILDSENDIFEVKGKSMPENAIIFYTPIFKWLEEYINEPNKVTIFNFYFTYYNTATSRVILEILVLLERIKEQGGLVLVKWHYHANDLDMKENGEKYAEMINLPFEYFEM